MKKLLLLPLLLACVLFCNSASVIPSVQKNQTFKISAISYENKLVSDNETEYIWQLHTDGCFYLYRVVIVGGILEFWYPLG